MPSLKQLEQEKAALDLKIAQSLAAARRMDEELEKARLRQEAIDKCTFDIEAALQRYNLQLQDVYPVTASVIKLQKKEGQTLREMRQFFNGH